MVKDTLVGYNYTRYQGDLVRTDRQHPHVIRREHATTYIDQFAFKQVELVAQLIPEQILTGWSRSYYLPEKHLEAVLQFGQPNIPVSAINVDVYRQSIAEAENRLSGLPTVRAYDVLTQLDQVPFKSSSAAGYDYQGRKGQYDGENHKRAITRAKAVLWSAIADDGEGIEHVISTFVPDVGYTRTQLTDLLEKTKVRQVWGRCFHYILLEGLVASPFINELMKHDTFIHAGKDPIFSVPELLSNVARNCRWLYALDWKQFDATVSRFEINTAFDIIKRKIIFPNYETEQAFEITRQLFIHKKVAAPDGYIYWSHKGIPSGSYYTSVVGSIVNFLRIDYLWRTLTGHPPKELHTLGDDSLSGDDILIEPQRIAEEAEKIGWHFNPEKTEYSRIPEHVTFLGRTYIGGLNKRDLTKCLRLLVYPEYPVDSGRISAYRANSIAQDAGGLSDVINRVANKLQRTYGIASEEEVPSHFKRYVIENIGI
uniref:RNA dependent RNA polymerase n=1 Tax=Pittosporum cryptic virus-1 TaxID=748427 RepID=A0A140KP50_9VIRU|nr:RdRp [Pittosporum cryptic virus-1]CEJ95596.2 RNA dependent RNA polymerase [Pittosporum cryptic virus-1]